MPPAQQHELSHVTSILDLKFLFRYGEDMVT